MKKKYKPLHKRIRKPIPKPTIVHKDDKSYNRKKDKDINIDEDDL